MYKNTLKDIERVENKLLEIREILNSEDGYTVCDAIIISINDEMLEGHVEGMLKTMGYEKEIVGKVVGIVKEIQR